jgi:hypothetical protein
VHSCHLQHSIVYTGVQDSDSSRRALQQDLFDDAPAEQDVSAYLAALAAAAGVRVEDLQFNESLDEKVGVHLLMLVHLHWFKAAMIYLQSQAVDLAALHSCL